MSETSNLMAWSNAGSLLHRLAVAARRYGLLETCRRGWRRAAEWLRERRLGIRTAGSIDAAELKTGSDSYGYQPIPYAALEAALRAIPIDSDDVFVDLGCGLGRAVVVAGLRPFQRVIGVEISPRLCRLARQNIKRATRHLWSSEVGIVEADARSYVLPDDATVLLLFNPFDEPILRCVLESIRQSLERSPRTLSIIYAIPNVQHDLLADVPWLQLQQTLPITDEAWLHLGIYRTWRDT